MPRHVTSTTDRAAGRPRRGSSALRAPRGAGSARARPRLRHRTARTLAGGAWLPGAGGRSRSGCARGDRRRFRHRDGMRRSRTRRMAARVRALTTRSSSPTTCTVRSSPGSCGALGADGRAALRDVRARQRSATAARRIPILPVGAGRACCSCRRRRLTVVAFEEGHSVAAGRDAVVQRIAAVGRRASLAGAPATFGAGLE